MWNGKTLISAYSPRATKDAAISTPLQWEELQLGVSPNNFTLMNIIERLKTKGDLFQPLLSKQNGQNLDFILDQIKTGT